MNNQVKIGCVVLALVGLSGLLTGCQRPTTTRPAHQAPRHSVPVLQLRELRHNAALRDSSIIYYGIKHSHIQRWQEAADFQLGWQVEMTRHNGQWRYSVWPDQHIQDAAKRLEPNWFTLTGQRVTYQSFVVHSNGDYQIKRTTLATIVAAINRDQAGNRVRQMPAHLRIKK